MSGTACFRQLRLPYENRMRWTTAIVVCFLIALPLALAVEDIEIAGIGNVRVTAEQRIGILPRLIFTDVSSGKLLGSVAIGQFDPKAAVTTTVARLKLKVLHLAGLPNPLILAVFDYGGGSDCLREAAPVAYVGGTFRSLLPRPLAFWTQEGFALGDLGKGLNPAFALFKELPSSKATHYEPHQFSVEVFAWDKATGQFRPSATWHTKSATDLRGAAAEFGFPGSTVVDFETLLKWFPDFSC